MRNIALILCSVLCISNAQSQIITTIAGNGTSGYSGDNGIAINCEMKYPEDVIFDSLGNLYIADEVNYCIRRINTSGIINTIAGDGTSGYSGDNNPAINAKLNLPIGVVFDKIGNLYIVDAFNNVIRKVNSSGIITTIAGTGTAGYAGDNGPATLAELNMPTGIDIDGIGNIYIADNGNNRVRKINISGTITTVGGTGTIGYTGDNGPATSAQLNGPGQIIVDNSGNLYFTDMNNNCVRKIDNTGIITTIAGTGVAGYSGDNGAAISAQLNQSFGLALDEIGSIFISDQKNHRIRKIDTSGIITTLVGTGTPGYNGDNILGTVAELNYPEGICFDKTGNLYIADNYNNRIRKVTNVGNMVVEEKKKTEISFKVYPNPNTGSFNISLKGKGKALAVEIYNVFGQQILNKQYNISNAEKMQINGLSEGVYLVKFIVDGIHTKAERIIVTK